MTSGPKLNGMGWMWPMNCSSTKEWLSFASFRPVQRLGIHSKRNILENEEALMFQTCTGVVATCCYCMSSVPSGEHVSGVNEDLPKQRKSRSSLQSDQIIFFAVNVWIVRVDLFRFCAQCTLDLAQMRQLKLQVTSARYWTACDATSSGSETNGALGLRRIRESPGYPLWFPFFVPNHPMYDMCSTAHSSTWTAALLRSTPKGGLKKKSGRLPEHLFSRETDLVEIGPCGPVQNRRMTLQDSQHSAC